MWKEVNGKTIIPVRIYCSISLVPATLQVLYVMRVSQSPLVINCTSTGLPPTQVVWSHHETQGRQILNDSNVYQADSYLIEGATSTYSNLLTINRNIEDVRGVFSCFISSTTTHPAQPSNITAGMSQKMLSEFHCITTNLVHNP